MEIITIYTEKYSASPITKTTIDNKSGANLNLYNVFIANTAKLKYSSLASRRFPRQA